MRPKRAKSTSKEIGVGIPVQDSQILYHLMMRNLRVQVRGEEKIGSQKIPSLEDFALYEPCEGSEDVKLAIQSLSRPSIFI